MFQYAGLLYVASTSYSEFFSKFFEHLELSWVYRLQSIVLTVGPIVQIRCIAMRDNSILVINSGSSSLKFAVINVKTEEQNLNGLAECLGTENAQVRWTHSQKKEQKALPKADHSGAFEFILTILDQLQMRNVLTGVGHRVVHGGERFTRSCIIDAKVQKAIQSCQYLAPLHTPANIAGIIAARKNFPHLKHIAVFDTSFHQTMPEKAYRYALPDKYYKEKGLRRYGMHGTSYRFVCQQAAKLINVDLNDSSFLIAHLGNGASAATVENGKSLDTTMGLTPLEGLVMGTRCGSVDPNIFSFLNKSYGYTLDQITHILNNQSGLLGLSGISNDCRILEEEVESGNIQAQLTIDVFCYNMAKQLAGISVSLSQLDAIVFTGGIGENSSLVRKKTLSHLALFNVQVDDKKNDDCRFGLEGVITTENSTVAMVISTNEELMIAQDTASFIK